MEDVLKDTRFAHIAKDPKFKKIPRRERKVKIDKRFQGMFKDKKFMVKCTIDKRGRPSDQSSMENFKKYYDLSSSEDDSKEQNSDQEDSDSNCVSSNGSLLLVNKVEESKMSDDIKQKLRDSKIDYARGEGVLVSDSSSSEESEDHSEEEEYEIQHDWGELDKEAETTKEITHRLALCNMDWDRIRALDIMVLLNSFLPSGGVIHTVTIYPSEYGLERMKEEEIRGPIELVEALPEDKKEEEDENEEGSQYHREKLRQYQLNRLKYYYAVIDFDSAETANKVYSECDGIEYESTATKLDLRFIPNDMEFSEESKDICTELPEFNKYEPRTFVTTALQQVRVNLTWDETNLDRQELAEKLNSGKLDDFNRDDLQAYLGSGTSDSESSDTGKPILSDDDINLNPIDKYKALLKNIEEQEKEETKQKQDVEMEFTWDIGKQEKAKQLVRERSKVKKQLTPFEEYLEKRKTKKGLKQRERKNSDFDEDEEDEDQGQNELELLLMDKTDGDGKQHFNMKEIEENTNISKSKKRRLNKKNKTLEEVKDDFQVDVKDPRFAALFTSHHYNIDPADTHFKKTKGTETIIQEKLKRRTNKEKIQEVECDRIKETSTLNTELQALVKSVKHNTKFITSQIK